MNSRVEPVATPRWSAITNVGCSGVHASAWPACLVRGHCRQINETRNSGLRATILLYLASGEAVRHTSSETGNKQVGEAVPYQICALTLIGRKGAAGGAIAWFQRPVVDGLLLFLLASRALSAKY
jgi:hypothetical protein